ncbi:DUF4381 domain-containing protein [Nitrosococcus watsonii]|uniref:DUF4381 domain-containing protein n=1 Tax=Nitrosococcus watsoni (strain C-113) TaxID=105559 RepID=D8K4B5_NITWC|nr:DUF4381 domain-containing protein [Nitrosococcus watsonii]ADJ27812.1 conserved hypothetical protein [Nitrosococcus watsonii C-113]
MNDNATSLDRLHDIVVPPQVAWWPPAPGWYGVLAIVAGVVIALLIWQWLRWRANAYRRTALRELDSAQTVAAISEILRRTALVIAPRSTLAPLTGSDWPTWLAARSPYPMPKQVSEQLEDSAYRKPQATADIRALREYAAGWIRYHRLPETADK